MDAAGDARVRLGEVVSDLEDRSPGLEAAGRRARVLADRLDVIAAGGEGYELRWIEASRKHLSLHAAPVDAGRALAAHIGERPCGWVFTSATLAVGDDFGPFLDRLGLEEARTLRLDSPFDFQRRTRLYLPEGLPMPSDPAHTRQVVEIALPLLAASGGRAFLLFTSHRALAEAARLMRARDLPFPLLVQGDEPRGRLLARFRELGNAVLLGTQSFWEGVDVRGPALSVVLIDKLPFAAPDDPLLKARLDSGPVPGRAAAPGGAVAEAGHRPADPGHGGLGPGGDLRSPAHRSRLRPGVCLEPAAHARHPLAGRGRGLPGKPGTAGRGGP